MKELLNYIKSIFTGKEKDSTTPEIKAMHWINKISIAVFLIAIIVMIIKRL